jgi:hypothetical protein
VALGNERVNALEHGPFAHGHRISGPPSGNGGPAAGTGMGEG